MEESIKTFEGAYGDIIREYESYVIIIPQYGSPYKKYKISEVDIYRHDTQEDKEFKFSNTFNRREVVMNFSKINYSEQQAKSIFYNSLNKYYHKNNNYGT